MNSITLHNYWIIISIALSMLFAALVYRDISLHFIIAYIFELLLLLFISYFSLRKFTFMKDSVYVFFPLRFNIRQHRKRIIYYQDIKKVTIAAGHGGVLLRITLKNKKKFEIHYDRIKKAKLKLIIKHLQDNNVDLDIQIDI